MLNYHDDYDYIEPSDRILITPNGEVRYNNDTICRYYGKDTVIEIPKEIDGTQIRVIGESAFRNWCSRLETVIIPDSVESIENYAFSGCENLQTVIIPSSVQYIWKGAFLYCEKLVIQGYKGTYAEIYAKKNKLPFKEIYKNYAD